jgi:serine/threonine protein kinase
VTEAIERIKVLDSGFAKLMETPDSSRDGTTLTAGLVTEEGTAIGTPCYMSPEEVEGRKLDARSDIFSFGSMLYEMIAGQRPFGGNSTISILANILSADLNSARRTGDCCPI